MLSKKIIIIGAGGFGIEVQEYIYDINVKNSTNHELKGFLDDDLSKNKKKFDIIDNIENHKVCSEISYIIAIGDTKLRRNIYNKLKLKDAKFFTVIHPKSYISPSSSYSSGCIFSPFSIVGTSSFIESQVVLNTHASVGHDAKIGSCSVISPKVLIGGNSVIGKDVFIGSSSVVTPGKKVGENAKVAAGSVVYRNVKENSFVIGNPAKQT